MLQEIILNIKDENGLGEIYNEMKLSFDRIEVSIHDIITERVFQEVESYNQKSEKARFSLVQPSPEEALLNTKKRQKKVVNAEKQVDVALKAFSSNGFFILVDDEQAENLEQVVTIKPDTSISFVKLTPLVGG